MQVLPKVRLTQLSDKETCMNEEVKCGIRVSKLIISTMHHDTDKDDSVSVQ